LLAVFSPVCKQQQRQPVLRTSLLEALRLWLRAWRWLVFLQQPWALPQQQVPLWTSLPHAATRAATDAAMAAVDEAAFEHVHYMKTRVPAKFN
jgi:hypothetical protein